MHSFGQVLANRRPKPLIKMTYTYEQKLIQLSAAKQSLACTQNCLAQSYLFPLKVAEGWWADARAKAREIEAIEADIEATQEATRTTLTKGIDPNV